MAKQKVAVVYGGPSREHDVSLNSGQAIVTALDKAKYDIHAVEISRDNKWQIKNTTYSLDDALEYLKQNVDFILIALHGTFGEDGTIQRLLEQRHIPFSGSGSGASRLAMHKDQTAKVLQKAGFNVPNEKVFTHGFTEDITAILEGFSLPVIVKPVAQGSSFGVAKVTDATQLVPAMQLALQADDKVLIQEYITGNEVSVGVIEDEKGVLHALPPTELIPLESDFFDYDAKYTKGAADEITPPNLPETVVSKIQTIALRVHDTIGCEGYSRTDMIIQDNEIVVIEINTLPGMTETSILPQQAQAAGISFSEMLDLIIAAGLRRHGV